MLRYFKEDLLCHIHIDSSFEKEDLPLIERLFDEPKIKWIIECSNIDILDADLVEFLYKKIFIEQKNIELQIHRQRLVRYLHKLGFHIHSIIHNQNIIDAHNIETILIGGSADSSQKIIEIIKNISLEKCTLIIVQHQSKGFFAQFDQVLQNYTSYPVTYAKDGEKVEKSHIYLAPANKHLLIDKGYFVLSDAPKYNFAKPSISLSYDSFALYYKEKLLIVQECGYLDDGVEKLPTAKKNSAKIIIQDPKECQGDTSSMVQKALETKSYDYRFTLEEIITYLDFLNRKYDFQTLFPYLTEKIYHIYGYDFREYHHETLQRRLQVFMTKHHIKDLKDAIGAILFHKNYFKSFFLELSINVTEFFRNPPMYEELYAILTTNFKNRESLKIWSAGCSNGEEAVSLAILLEKANKLQHSLIYATDMNKVVLAEAQNALYPLETYKKAEKNLSQTNLELPLTPYFICNDHYVRVQQFIIKKILYFEHNLATDSSFNEFDIIVCSNVLIYFTQKLQKRVFSLLYDSLQDGGFLVLGEKELIHQDFASKFERYSYMAPIYVKKG